MAKYNYEHIFHDVSQKECERVAKAIVKEIQESPLTPVKTGRLKRGYKTRRTTTGSMVYTHVPYALHAEYNIRAHFRPAIEKIRGELS